EIKCSVLEVEDSYIPGVKILTMHCGRVSLKLDISKDLNPAEKGDIVNVGVYKSLPPYNKGVDFVAQGYVVAKRKQDDLIKIYISLWGYLVIVSTADIEIESMFDPMDKVYVKIWK
ncbi:MAG: DNA-directed RNA polymerase subunit G, partial [Ignisphaera sp.]